jgi:hypothetical protein
MESIRQRKIRAILNKNKNIQQISYLLSSKFDTNSFISIENTDIILKMYKESVILRDQVCGLLKNTDFENLILNLKNNHVERFFIISEFSFDSGLYILNKLTDFNFDFNDYGFYRITLLLENLRGQISFFEDSKTEIEICVSGELASESIVKLLKFNK